MPYTISWHLQNHVLHVQFTGDVTEIDLVDSSADLHSMLSTCATPVHIVYNGIHILDYPNSMAAVKQALRHFCLLPAMGWLIFTGFNAPDTSLVGSAVMQVMMRNFKHAHSMEDVDLILSKVDPALESLLTRTRA